MNDSREQPVTGDRVAEITARLEAATPGPWEDDGDSISQHFMVSDGKYVAVLEMTGDSGWSGCDHAVKYTDADGDLIAHAPADLAYLLAELESLRDELDATQAHGAKAVHDRDEAWRERDDAEAELESARGRLAAVEASMRDVAEGWATEAARFEREANAKDESGFKRAAELRKAKANTFIRFSSALDRAITAALATGEGEGR